MRPLHFLKKKETPSIVPYKCEVAAFLDNVFLGHVVRMKDTYTTYTGNKVDIEIHNLDVYKLNSKMGFCVHNFIGERCQQPVFLVDTRGRLVRKIQTISWRIDKDYQRQLTKINMEGIEV